jgi:signal transduction histidine kinase
MGISLTVRGWSAPNSMETQGGGTDDRSLSPDRPEDAIGDAAGVAAVASLAFLGRVSHELRAPLNVIHGYVDLLDQEVHGPVTAKQRADLNCIRAGEKQLLVMISDLLDFLKVQSGQLTYRSSDVPLRELLTGALVLMEPMMQENGLAHLGVSCGSDVTVRADPDRIRQILFNLLTNAIKFTTPGGRIRVECDASEDVVRIRVSDTGVGIPPDRLEAIFEPFVQAANGPTGSRHGWGLGLAISRDLARAMAGDLAVASAIAVGSEFTLTLPRGRPGGTHFVPVGSPA